jgi:hypothetical protein
MVGAGMEGGGQHMIRVRRVPLCSNEALKVRSLLST